MMPCILLLILSVSAIEPNETKAMLEYYQQHTGKPAHTLIEENWGRDTSGIWIIPEYRQGCGDLDMDGIVGPKDLVRLNNIMGVICGWTVNKDIGHLYLDCYQLSRSTRPKTIEKCKRICLMCAARRLNND